MVILRTLLGLLVLGGPPAFSAWVGTRIRSSVGAFFAAWFLTPLLTCIVMIVGWPFLRMMSGPNNDGTWVIMVPIMSVGSGLVAGIVAAVIAGNRRRMGQAIETASSNSDAPAI